MFEFFANIFGYLLQFLYTLVNNYGLAIILFTLIIKLLLLPLSIKQQKTMKKSSELQEKVKVMQFKYKNDPEKLNKEMMNLYKTENVSPFSGCLTSIIQMLLLLSIFYLVRSPLTFMEKIPQENINTYIQQLKDEGKVISNVYPEIDLIRETELLKEKNPEDQFIEKTNIKMNFLGLDLSKIQYILFQYYIFYHLLYQSELQQQSNKKIKKIRSQKILMEIQEKKLKKKITKWML